VGHERPPREPRQERDVVPDARATRARAARPLPCVACRHADGARSAARITHLRGEAVRGVESDQRHRGDAADLERTSPRTWRGRESGRDAGADGRPHLQHRLRAGGGRRAAGEPDALQPVLSGEARLLPGELGLFGFGGVAATGGGDCPDPVSQPPHRLSTPAAPCPSKPAGA
jgi:hypothetical protein